LEIKDIKKYLPVLLFVLFVIVFAVSKKSDNTDKDSNLTLITEKNSDNDGDLIVTKTDSELETNEESSEAETEEIVEYKFRNDYLLSQHYKKHGIEMGFDSKEDYEKAASLVVNNKDALHKTEEEDGDDVYYVESTNEFVVVSTDGFIRTYFNPNGGIDYFNRQ
jgi:pyocin large subunit-like protein